MIIDVCGKSVINGIPRASAKTKAALREALAKTSALSLQFWREKMIPMIKAKFQQKIQDMLLLMPKQEMANLAEAMVILTSIKRKFLSEKETIAGPIDVAVISQSDGFIWVKCKHYFDKKLNPGYFVRKFGNAKDEGDRHAAR